MRHSLPSQMGYWLRRLQYWWRREQFESELAEEIEFHAEQKRAANLEAGLDARLAGELSRRQMGNTTAAVEECREAWSFMIWERLVQDLRHSFRMYGRTPVFTGICTLSIALGIGGNVAMFSLVDALLLRPLPYAAPERLVRITGIHPRAAVPFFQSRSRAMEVAAVSAGSELNLAGQGNAVRLVGSSVTANFFSVLGAPVGRGRGFEGGEEAPGRDGVVILSHALWKTHFDGDESVIGRVVRLNGVDRRVVGIMPAGFSYPSTKVQLWIPMRMDASNFLEYWGSEFMPLVGRLREGASLAQAQAEARALAREFRGQFPYPMPRDFNANSTAIPLQQDIVGDARGRLLILLCSVAAVLLIACSNVASLLLSRATIRRRELALRAALGADRARIMRQLLTESVGLSLAGAVLGVLFGLSALSLFKTVLPASLPGLAEAGVDWRIVLAVTGLAALAGLASGLAPALSASQVDITEMIKTGSQRATSGFWTRLRGLLIAGEVAMTLVLLISAGLLLRSVYQLSTTHPGFDSRDVWSVQISPNPASCSQREACVAFYQRLVERARGVHGIADAAVSNSIPLDGRVPTVPVDVEGHRKTAENPAPMLWLGTVSANYLPMLHVPLLAGRHLRDSDGAGSTPVIVVPASTARRFWPGESAVGKHIRLAGSNAWRTVVGVVGDVNVYTLRRALPDGVAGVVYMPYAQSDQGDGQIPAAMALVAKTEAGGASAAREIGQLAKEQDPNVPVGPVQALNELAAGSIREIRSTMLVFVSFGGVAIALAAVGIYGLMSFWVSQRTYEIGLRVAVGCSQREVLTMIMARGLNLALYGVIGGIAGALVLTRFLATMLHGVTATDLPTFATVTGLILGVAAMATALPAWRAARIDPLKALRAE